MHGISKAHIFIVNSLNYFLYNHALENEPFISNNADAPISSGRTPSVEFDHSKTLFDAWSSLSMPAREEDLVGKWYSVIFKNDKGKDLYVGKVVRRFLH